MRKILSLFTVTLFVAAGSFAQNGLSRSDVISRLKAFLALQKSERAYLHFDKPYYEAGDTIYFKAYITQGDRHQPSQLSGVLHVDLINTENRIAQSIQLHNEDGTCYGDFALPDSLLAGVYRVRAYTQWMRNSGEKDFFEKLINVGSVIKAHPLASISKQAKVIRQTNDLQFFPEAGSLVTGINTKIAFKAIGTNGLAINVKGVILDNNNKECGSFSSTHLGMGSFFLNAAENTTYNAKVTFADGSQTTIDLPKPSASGISLTVNTDSIAKTLIAVKANTAYYKLNQNKDFLLIIYSGGKVISAPFKLENPEITLTISKEQLHTGVATVTLFSADGDPLCERLMFVQGNDGLVLQINSDKTVYRKREKVNLQLNATNKTVSDTSGDFSISVIDESRVPSDELNERNILTDLLLTSEVKGFVEQPNYYFIDTIKNARSNLDVLMLTQGYRSFDWKEALDTSKASIVYQPEKGLQINGQITALKGTPLSNETVNLIPSQGGPLLTSTSDDKGFFHFSNLIFTDTLHFVLSIANAKQKNSTTIKYMPVINEPAVTLYQPASSQLGIDKNMQVYMDSSKKYHNRLARYTEENATVLTEVKIKDTKPADPYRTQNLAGAGNADQVLNSDALEKVQGTLVTRLNGRLNGVGFADGVPYLQAPVIRSQSSTTVNAPMLVIVDGTEVNPGGALYDLNQIDASLVETVEVLKYAGTSLYGVEGANGVLIITTRQEKGSFSNIAAVGVLPIAPMGFYQARTFYSPKYDYNNTMQPDGRSTIYWNPEIKPGKDGNASCSYYNADGTGTYKVVIEGIDSDGNIGRSVYRYTVK